MIWTVEDLQDMFHSSGFWVNQFDPGYSYMLELLNAHVIVVEDFYYMPAAIPDPTHELYNVYKQAFMDTGGSRHGHFKWDAWNWLRKQGDINPLFEFATGVGYSDAYSSTLGYFIECGDTQITKVIDGFKFNLCNATILFPYYDIELDGSRKAHKFVLQDPHKFEVLNDKRKEYMIKLLEKAGL